MTETTEFPPWLDTFRDVLSARERAAHVAEQAAKQVKVAEARFHTARGAVHGVLKAAGVTEQEALQTLQRQQQLLQQAQAEQEVAPSPDPSLLDPPPGPPEEESPPLSEGGFMMIRALLLSVIFWAASALLVAQVFDVPAVVAEQAQAPAKLALLVDMDADPFNQGTSPGCVFLLELDTGMMLPLLSPDTFQSPTHVFINGDELWVTDIVGGEVMSLPNRITNLAEAAAPPVYSGLTYPVRVDEVNGRQFLVGRDGLYEIEANGTLSLLFAARGPQLQLPSQVFEGPNGEICVLDADGDPNSNPLGATGFPQEGAIWTLEQDGSLDLMLASGGGTISWMSAVTIPQDGSQWAGQTVLLDANAGIHVPGQGAIGKLFVTDLSVSDPTVQLLYDAAGLADPTGIVYWKPGKLLITDLNADPNALGWDGLMPPVGYSTFGRGCVYVYDLATNTLQPLAATMEMVSPTRLTLV